MITSRFLILGGSGFIGTHLNQFCLDENIKALNLSSKDVNLLNIGSINKLISLFTPETTLIIASAINREVGDNLETMFKNIQMARTIAEALLLKPVKKCIYLSTADVYGHPSALPITEKTKIEPLTYYAASKYCCEQIIQISCQKVSLPLLTLRYNGVYGPQQPRTGYGPNAFIKSITEERLIRIWGDGEELRDNLYVKDLAKVIIKLALTSQQGIFNIATGKSLTFMEMVKKIKNISPIPFEIVKRDRTSTSFDQVFDIAKLTESLPGLEFTKPIEAYQETFNYYLNLHPKLQGK